MSESTPDEMEQALGDQEDNAVPSQGYRMRPVVVLGGADGAIAGLPAILGTVSSCAGAAFVLVLDVAADDAVALASTLAQSTTLRVVLLEQRARVEADTVYVVPPRKLVRSWAGTLELADLPPNQGHGAAIDYIFRAFADTHGAHAVAVVLSGGEGAGAMGIRRIKERGGLTVAQEPQEASRSEMVCAAIATGMMDWVLPAAEICSRVAGYLALERDLRLPAEHAEPPRSERIASDPSPDRLGSSGVPGTAEGAEEAAFQQVLAFVRGRTGRDFGDYKRATVLRRLGRRMQVNGVTDLSGYLECLRTRPGEAGALVKDMLISVTNFFRDADCFGALEHVIPELFRNKTSADTLRVWVVACATGEEAYSLAILLNEHARTLSDPPAIQVFATDLDEEAIRTAREAFFPLAAQVDLSQERLRRFFLKEAGGYRVRRELREQVLFAVHDILRDSPFSRVHLVSCRNLLIYLNRDAQQRVFDTLHFSLVPGGRLFLGASETIEENGALFTVLDSRHRVYASRPVTRTGLPIPSGRSSPSLAMRSPHVAPVIAKAAHHTAVRLTPLQAPDGRPLSWAELHLRLLDRLGPPSILLGPDHEMLHVTPAATQFLHFLAGEPSRNVLQAVLPELRVELQTALYQLAASGDSVEVTAANGGSPGITALPVPELDGAILVQFRRAAPLPALPALTGPSGEAGAPAAGQGLVAPASVEPVTRHLEREIERLRGQLRQTMEQHEVFVEELKATNEELQAMNEELHSAAEELESSREELQSLNEELTTVNQEINGKVESLAHANSDMLNLMDASAIATVFLDRSFRVMRFTPSAVALFNFIPADVGRPLSDLTTPLDYPALTDDAGQVLATLEIIEREVGDAQGNWYLARVRPYRTIDDRIAGIVMTFVDVTERKQAQELLRRSQERFSAIVNQASVGVAQTGLDGVITLANVTFQRQVGYTEEEVLGRNALDLVHPADRSNAQGLFERVVTHGEPFQSEMRNVRQDGSTIWLHKSVTVLNGQDGRPDSALIVCIDVGERKLAEEALRQSEENLRLVLENAVDYAIFSMDLSRRVKSWNAGAERLLGYREAEIIGTSGDIIFTEGDRTAGAPEEEAHLALAMGRAADERLHQRKNGSRFWASGALMPMHNSEGAVVGLVKILRDQSEQRKAQQELEQSRTELLQALRANEAARAALEAEHATKDRFLAVLSHELRNPLASIAGAADLLVPESALAADHARAARVVRRQAAAMKVLLGDLLDVSTLGRGQLILRRERTSAHAAAEAAAEATSPLIIQRNHAFELRSSTEDIDLDADPIRLTQVLTNLLTNAAKYTPDGGRIELSVRAEGADVVFEVMDNGIGMDPTQVETMFDMFAQSDAARERAAGGLGIGLALVRNIVQLHGGRVLGCSAGVGQGSRFTVRLPRLVSGAPAASAASDATAEPGSASGARKVMLVDDNEDALWGMARMLSLSGYVVETAADGPSALRLGARFGPDAAVLDIGMPGMDGYELARRLRKEAWGQGMFLVAATGWGQPGDRRQALEAGFDAHLVKPVSVADVERLLREQTR